MQLRRLFRTSVFQLTLGYMALFAVSVGALSAFIYWATLGYLERQTSATIEAELAGLYEQFERRGLRGLADIINERVQRDSERRSVYLLADAIGVRAGFLLVPVLIGAAVTLVLRGTADARAREPAHGTIGP